MSEALSCHVAERDAPQRVLTAPVRTPKRNSRRQGTQSDHQRISRYVPRLAVILNSVVCDSPLQHRTPSPNPTHTIVIEAPDIDALETSFRDGFLDHADNDSMHVDEEDEPEQQVDEDGKHLH